MLEKRCVSVDEIFNFMILKNYLFLVSTKVGAFSTNSNISPWMVFCPNYLFIYLSL